MRKIESQMIEAVRECLNWKSANTEVETNIDGVSQVFLHGNLIAEVSYDESNDHFYSVRLFDGGWQSKTTKSRLNALLSAFGTPGQRVFAKNFDWYLQESPRAVPFRSGMQAV